jgi:hypothetical protein
MLVRPSLHHWFFFTFFLLMHLASRISVEQKGLRRSPLHHQSVDWAMEVKNNTKIDTLLLVLHV